MDRGGGVDVAKNGDEEAKGEALGRCASVLGRLAVGGEAADVADAEGVGVVTRAMCACLDDGASWLHCAINADDEVVADACPALGTVPAIDVGGSEILAFGCGRAMNDD